MSNQSQMQQTSQIDFVPPTYRYLEHQPFNSAFFRDHCEEQYQIQRAFRADNFTSLRKKIPNQLKYGAILEERIQKVQSTTEVEADSRAKTDDKKEEERKSRIAKKKMQQVGQLGYFQVFPYQESLYDIQHEIKLREWQQSKKMQQQISELDFRPSGFDRKLKCEDPFSYVDKIFGPNYKNQYIFPFHIPEDTYDRFHQSELRNRIIQESGKIAGEFTPSLNDRSLSKINKSRAPEIIREIEVYLKKFISQIGFFIGLNRKDHIDLLFPADQVDSPKLQLLMSKICESEALSKYILRRNHQKWGKIGQKGYLEYCLLPPWVKDPEEKLIRGQ